MKAKELYEELREEHTAREVEHIMCDGEALMQMGITSQELVEAVHTLAQAEQAIEPTQQAYISDSGETYEAHAEEVVPGMLV